MWLLLKDPTESATAEMFNAVMFTESPSAACEVPVGRARRAIPRLTVAKTDVIRDQPSRTDLNFGAN
jgi:hypothetical protein